MSSPCTALAVPVPWRLERAGPHPTVTNASAEPLEYVTALVFDGADRLTSESWGLMLPGERSELCLCGFDPADLAVVLSWCRVGDERELLWRFVM